MTTNNKTIIKDGRVHKYGGLTNNDNKTDETAFINAMERIVRLYVDTTPMADVLCTLAGFGYTVKILNTKLSKESTPDHLVYVPAFSVSFAKDGIPVVQYLYEKDLNQALTNGIMFISGSDINVTNWINSIMNYCANKYVQDVKHMTEHFTKRFFKDLVNKNDKK